MAIIQMINDEVIYVDESASDVADEINKAGKYPVSIMRLSIAEAHGGGHMWINAKAISSFADETRGE